MKFDSFICEFEYNILTLNSTKATQVFQVTETNFLAH